MNINIKLAINVHWVRSNIKLSSGATINPADVAPTKERKHTNYVEAIKQNVVF